MCLEKLFHLLKESKEKESRLIMEEERSTSIITPVDGSVTNLVDNHDVDRDSFIIPPDIEATPDSGSVGTVPSAEEIKTKPEIDVIMPNQMCEVPCHFQVNAYTNGEALSYISSSDDEEDIRFNEETQTIEGTPRSSRDFCMKLEGLDTIYCFKCFVNPNPRLMWKEVPSDQLVKKDKDYKAILSSRVDLVAVSHRGRTHAKEGAYRDDDFFISLVGECALTIVADGAGSASQSSVGSKVFCQEAGMHFEELFKSKKDTLANIMEGIKQRGESPMKNQGVIKELYEIFPAAALYGRKVLSKLAAENEVPLKQYHTTALFSFIMPIENGGYFCAAFQIGDGITAVLADGGLILLGEADSGSFPGETVFVTSNGVFGDASALVNRIRCCFCNNTPVLISMTDGITDSYFKEGIGVDELGLWKKLLSEIQNEEGVLKPADVICDWLDYYVPQEHDDRTMTIVKYK